VSEPRLSKYARTPLDLTGLKTIPIADRGGKVRVEDFAAPYQTGAGVEGWVSRLPRILAGDQFRAAVDALAAARAGRKTVVWGLGGHVIKCGLAPVLLDLMQRGYIAAFMMNGAAAIHDFEIAIAGQTSEDVEAVLPDGRFGTAEETGREMNLAIAAGDGDGLGLGEALGRRLDEMAWPEYAPYSIVLQAWRAAVPVTVHVAIGTDTPHTHPCADPAAIGSASHRDFLLFCRLVSELGDGGVYVNCGSAVVLPEVFLKALSSVRNLGTPVRNFTTINLDFFQHYRPRVNVVERPHSRAGGRGIALTGHHELMVPLLAAALIESER
jgi:hypothetical protein